jgi:hypothetical protein
MIIYLFEFIRNRYYFQPERENESDIRLLAAKSGVNEKDIKQLFLKASFIESKEKINKDTLVDFYRLTESFYKHCI